MGYCSNSCSSDNKYMGNEEARIEGWNAMDVAYTFP
jgi:hypothetical protein